MDHLTLEAFQKNGGDMKSIAKSHIAYPLITLGTKKAVYNFCIHICNGCISDSAEMVVVKGEQNYQNTGVMLTTYKSLHGTSKVEILHSVVEVTMHVYHNIMKICFDAWLHWKITNYNQQIL